MEIKLVKINYKKGEKLMIVDKDGKMFEDRRKNKTDRRKNQIAVEHEKRKSERKKKNNKKRK